MQYVLLLNAKVTTDPIKHQESRNDETWAILKNSINFHRKWRKRKGRSLITPNFFKRFWFLQRRYVLQYVFISNSKVKKYSIKHQESIVDETWAILKNSINFHRKMPMKQGSLVKNSYIFKPTLILSTLLISAVCPLVKCKSEEGSDKASRIYSRWNMSNS